MFDKTRFGPAIPICVGALLGGTFGVPLLREENPIGFLFVFPGSLLGGLFYRIYSRNWPTDPTAFKRRYLSAFSILVLIPIIAATVTEMRGPNPVLNGVPLTSITFNWRLAVLANSCHLW